MVSQRKADSLLGGSSWCKYSQDHSCVLIKTSIQKARISMTWFVGSSMEAEDNPLTPWLLPFVWLRCSVGKMLQPRKNSVVLASMLLVLFLDL